MMTMLRMMMMLMIMLMFADLDGCQATPPCSQTLVSNLVCRQWHTSKFKQLKPL